MPYISYSDKTQSDKTRHQNGGRKQSWWLELRGLSPGTKAKQKGVQQLPQVTTKKRRDLMDH